MPLIDENLDGDTSTLTNTTIGNGSIAISISPENELKILRNQVIFYLIFPETPNEG
jgi:hypothetical protein